MDGLYPVDESYDIQVMCEEPEIIRIGDTYYFLTYDMGHMITRFAYIITLDEARLLATKQMDFDDIVKKYGYSYFKFDEFLREMKLKVPMKKDEM